MTPTSEIGVRGAAGLGANARDAVARCLSAELCGWGLAMDRAFPLYARLRLKCGRSSVVEHNLAKVGVESSNLFTRSSLQFRNNDLAQAQPTRLGLLLFRVATLRAAYYSDFWHSQLSAFNRNGLTGVSFL